MDLNIPFHAFNEELAQELIKFNYKTVALVIPNQKDLKLPTITQTYGLEVLLRVDCTLSNFKPGIRADLIAVRAESEQELEKCIGLPIDIVVLDKMRIKRKTINQLKQNCIAIELLYTKGYTLEGRKDLIYMGNMLSRMNAEFILSSGANHAIQLRGRRDLINACLLFHLKVDKATKILDSGAKIVIKGQSRKTFKGILAVEKDLKRMGDELLSDNKRTR